MIKTIIFDFGDVFINLDKPATIRELSKLGNFSLTDDVTTTFDQYEVGNINTSEFITYLQSTVNNASEEEVINAWNAILLDFPKHRLDFIKQLASENKYKLLLLSNTNELHIDWIKNNISFFKEFKSCFESFYLSHEIHLRKPNSNIFNFVLDDHLIDPTETLFIDDTAINTKSASELGIHTWNNDPKTEDVTDLFSTKSDLF